MPLCPQITNTPVTVTQTSDFTVTSVSPVVPATTADVAVAQATADSAASAASTAASAASTAQTTADGKNKIYRQGTTPTGTFAVGDTWFNTSSDNAISRWDGSSWVATTLGNSALASISASKITAGTIDASVITVSNINAGNIVTGTINSIAFNNGSGTFQVTSAGALTASSANITGTINATSGYIGSTSTGWQFTSSGYLYSSDTTFYPTTSPGGNANTYSIFTNRGVYAERIYSTNTTTASIYSSGGIAVQGAISGGAASFLVNSSGSITAVVNITQSGTLTGNTGITSSGAITTSGNISTSGSGSITAQGSLYAAGHTTTASAANGYVNASTGLIARSTASSQRYKQDIVNLVDIAELSPFKLLDLPVRAFRFKDGYLTTGDDREGMLVPGFIAEEVDAIYPVGADYNAGQVETWNDRMIVPAMLALIQNQETRIKALEGK